MHSTKVHYLVTDQTRTSEAPVHLLVPNPANSASNWLDVLAELRAHAHAIAVDLPGTIAGHTALPNPLSRESSWWSSSCSAPFGLLVLTVAADHLVIGSSRLAARLLIDPVVVGVVVIGLGTSAPEFLVSGVAAARGDTGIAVGNLVGSNVPNLTLTLGVAALIRPLAVSTTVVRREIPLAVAAVAVFGLLAWWRLDPITATLLAALTVPLLLSG